MQSLRTQPVFKKNLNLAYAKALKELAEAEYAYKQANANHYLRSEGTVNERSAIAVKGARKSWSGSYSLKRDGTFSRSRSKTHDR